ncbi:hypothetical protein L873DRAFT_1758565 [Choiromyces venosus 120613-1]|uniref:Uncharacterized protein n=1 Tax=Choiromyces venosus 120613-1 TaxID=1336337 RepID=A0A3N4K2S8_9PEZI|nr:hypothetical protein L873DRAFT_1758565 [Choiromyces venosus 120613-1]
MTLQRLRSITQLTGIINPKCATYPRTHFSTVCPRLLQHPTPSKTRLLPRILDPSVWFPFYNTEGKKGKAGSKKKKPKIQNPATFFVIMAMLIGSQGIQMIRIRQTHEDYMWRADTKIAVLREVIERLEKGEDVDVEKMLGTGNEKEEKSWEEVLKQLEEEDAEWTAKRNQKAQPTPSMERKDKAAAEIFKPEEKPEENKASGEGPSKPRGPRSARDYGFS